MFASPSTRESNASSLLSGDQEGVPVSASKWVICWTLCPSESEIQTSCDPLRSDSKAIFEPLGEIAGLFWLRVDAMSICATGSPVRFSFQMLAEREDCT